MISVCPDRDACAACGGTGRVVIACANSGRCGVGPSGCGMCFATCPFCRPAAEDGVALPGQRFLPGAVVRFANGPNMLVARSSPLLTVALFLSDDKVRLARLRTVRTDTLSLVAERAEIAEPE